MPVTGGTVASARPALYMPVQIAGPRSIGRPPDTAQRTVLLTGASGVVGRALLRRLRGFDVVCLVHRSPVSGPNVTAVPGDIAQADVRAGRAGLRGAGGQGRRGHPLRGDHGLQPHRRQPRGDEHRGHGTRDGLRRGGGGEARPVPRQHRVRAHHGGRRPRSHCHRLRLVEAGGRAGRTVQRPAARHPAALGRHRRLGYRRDHRVPGPAPGRGRPVRGHRADDPVRPRLADRLRPRRCRRRLDRLPGREPGERGRILDQRRRGGAEPGRGSGGGRRVRARPGRAPSTCRGSCRRRCSTG